MNSMCDTAIASLPCAFMKCFSALRGPDKLIASDGSLKLFSLLVLLSK